MKTCKKLGKILLCAGMLTAAAAVPAFAADVQTTPNANVTFSVDKTQVAVGEDVTVTISNKDATLAGFGFYLSFDTPKLYCTGVNDAKGKATFVDNFTDDRITLTETAGEAAEGIYSFGVAAAAETTYVADEVVTLTFRADQAGTANLVLVENSATTAKGVGHKGTVVTQPIEIVEASDDEFTVGGNITSYLAADGEVTVELFKDGAETAAYKETTTTGAYSIENVAAGSYTMKVSKENHVTREYAISATGGTVDQAVRICMEGDVDMNGVVNIIDHQCLFEHLQGITTITDEYQLKIANVKDTDTIINIIDHQCLFEHLQGINPLF